MVCPNHKVSHLATVLHLYNLCLREGGADNSAFYDLISQEVHHVIVAHVVVTFSIEDWLPVLNRLDEWVKVVFSSLPVGYFTGTLQRGFWQHSGECNFV